MALAAIYLPGRRPPRQRLAPCLTYRIRLACRLLKLCYSCALSLLLVLSFNSYRIKHPARIVLKVCDTNLTLALIYRICHQKPSFPVQNCPSSQIPITFLAAKHTLRGCSERSNCIGC